MIVALPHHQHHEPKKPRPGGWGRRCDGYIEHLCPLILLSAEGCTQLHSSVDLYVNMEVVRKDFNRRIRGKKKGEICLEADMIFTNKKNKQATREEPGVAP